MAFFYIYKIVTIPNGPSFSHNSFFSLPLAFYRGCDIAQWLRISVSESNYLPCSSLHPNAGCVTLDKSLSFSVSPVLSLLVCEMGLLARLTMFIIGIRNIAGYGGAQLQCQHSEGWGKKITSLRPI